MLILYSELGVKAFIWELTTANQRVSNAVFYVSSYILRGYAKKMRLVNIRAPNAVAIGHSLNLKGSTDSSGKKH